MVGTGVGVGDAGGAVAEIVAKGVRRISISWVANGVGSNGAGVSTSTLNVQPEIKKMIEMQNADNFFTANPFMIYRPDKSNDWGIK